MLLLHGHFLVQQVNWFALAGWAVSQPESLESAHAITP